MACLGHDGDGERQCLTVNDEELSAEIVTLKGDAFHVTSHKDPIILVDEDGVFRAETNCALPRGR